MGRNDNDTLGIPRANLELKHWSYVHNFFQFGAVTNHEIELATLITKQMFFCFQNTMTCLSHPADKYSFKVKNRRTILI